MLLARLKDVPGQALLKRKGLQVNRNVRLRGLRPQSIFRPAMAAAALQPNLTFRPGTLADLEALLALEQAAFTTDRMSRRSFRRFINTPSAAMIVADEDGRLSGYALVLFRPASAIARLYSIAVASAASGKGFGSMLLAAVEGAARRRDCTALRLEVHEQNAAAIKRYREAGFQQFGIYPDYYDGRGTALRFEKPLRSPSTERKDSASPVAAIAR
jgi:[ribosomal protein S18]-alanine N-acetyltransferase